ncbi:hypothetical protein HDV01_003314 [Terramyces sp. JEL0728]|nr:hypothetical protein HDV01_003314 [Terramyces sp. JEL0728]
MFTGGGLKLKGDKVKKKKKDKAKEKEVQIESEPYVPYKTATELKHEKIKKMRLEDKIEKAAEKSHKERVADFNKYLSSLSEHHDIPRVGPG